MAMVSVHTRCADSVKEGTLAPSPDGTTLEHAGALGSGRAGEDDKRAASSSRRVAAKLI